jgi:putative transposase
VTAIMAREPCPGRGEGEGNGIRGDHRASASQRCIAAIVGGRRVASSRLASVSGFSLPVLAQISTRLRNTGDLRGPAVPSRMVTILSVVVSIFAFRFRSRASLELRLIALQHQLAVLRRQRPGRPQLSSLDRLLWVWLYRVWPRVIDAMILVKPATVVQWHRKGFRLHRRWRSRRPGRPKIGTEIRALIRRMSRANPLWGAPRIHGELLKLDIKISQATVGRWLPWRPKVPSPTWRSFLRNHLPDFAAIDMFVVATATFQLLYTLIVLSLDRRRSTAFK